MNETKAILQAVFGDPLLGEDCATCQADLAAYIDAELDGQPAADLFPMVAAHLPACANCQQVYGELQSLLTAEWRGRFELPPVPAAFDFAYLPAENQAVTRAAWRLDKLGRLVIQLTADLLRSRQGPTWQPGYLKSGRAPVLDYRLAGEVDDLNVHITAEPAPRDPQRLTVAVAVDIPSRGGWPNLAGSLVTLRRGDEVVEEQETDAFGKAVFEGVPVQDLPDLVFEIAHV
jgi:hypothetical protein